MTNKRKAAGFRLVPVDPTEEMARRFISVFVDNSFRLAWRAALAVAPFPEGYDTGPENEDALPRSDPQTGIDCTTERVAPASPEGVDAIVTRLYRRFKDWSERGFGPDDVTWCEVRADVLAIIAASPAPPGYEWFYGALRRSRVASAPPEIVAREQALIDVRSALAEQGVDDWVVDDVMRRCGLASTVEPPRTAREPDHAPVPLTLTSLHIKLLQRGARGQYIGLVDDMGRRVGEVAALGELHRAGYVEDAKGPFPPGPPSLTPSVITEAGRRALKETDPGRPVPRHGSGPDNQ